MNGGMAFGGSAEEPGVQPPGPVIALAKLCFAALVFLLIWMRPIVTIDGLAVVPSDGLFLLASALWLLALFRGEARLRWHPAFWLLVAYFAAMSLSLLASANPERSAFKLATQAYLLALPVLTYNLLETWADVRRVFVAWLAASAVLACLAAATLLLFPFLGSESVLSATLHHYGTLPPGDYPRLELTFEFPSMLANYLTASLMIVLIARSLGWLTAPAAWILAAGIGLAAFFALTPGFAGLLFAVALWCKLVMARERPRLANILLVTGLAGAAAFLLAAAATPIMHWTAPFVIHVPGLAEPLAPSVRLLAWIDAWRVFLDRPITGIGIGVGPVHVPYETPSGSFGYVTDAHNTFLNIAAQCGIAGLAGIVIILIYALRSAASSRLDQADVVRTGLAIAFLSGMAVHGAVGSFEDARHLWIVLGLMLVATRLAQASRAGPQKSCAPTISRDR